MYVCKCEYVYVCTYVFMCVYLCVCVLLHFLISDNMEILCFMTLESIGIYLREYYIVYNIHIYIIYIRLFMCVLFEDGRNTSSLFKFRTAVVLLTDLKHIVFTL